MIRRSSAMPLVAALAFTATFPSAGIQTVTSAEVSGTTAYPLGVPDTGSFRLVNPDGQTSNAYAFSIGPPPPTITGVNPNPVPGTPGLHLVTITGSDFVNKPTVINSWQVLGGGSGPVNPSRVTFVSSTEITVLLNIAVAPDGQRFQVVNPDGQVSNVWDYNIAAPTLPGPGTFAATGQMSTPRGGYTATLLANGKVLIAGGLQFAPQHYLGTALATAELYDPATGAFSATGSMTVARQGASATLLLDGRVLIAGGFNGSAESSGSALSSTELYDPSTGTFTAAGNMITARGGHDAFLLDNGTVLFLGGSGSNSVNSGWAPAEIYDPTTGTFTLTGPYVGSGSCDFCAPSVLLSNGLVLFTGQSPAQLYDPRGGVFMPTGSKGGGETAGTLLMNGKVLYAGGEDIGRSSAAQLYDPRLGTFGPTGSMAWRRVWHTLTLLPDGTVLTAGGDTDDCTNNFCHFAGTVASAELYDPATGAFSSTGSMTAAREGHTATVLNDGRVLIVGGLSYGPMGLFFGSSGTAELYTPTVLVPAPTVLTVSGDSTTGIILHAATGQLVTADNPAVAGELLQIPCTNLNDGSVIRPRVIIGGVLAELVTSSTSADGPIAIKWLTVRMPTVVASGSAVRFAVRYIGRTSNQVMLAVQ